jgi:hypothetical protein
LKRLFEPLGYRLSVTAQPLDEEVAEWSPSSVFTVTIVRMKTLSDLLSHLYVLIPVLDNEKHYWVGDDEIAKARRWHSLSRHIGTVLLREHVGAGCDGRA